MRPENACAKDGAGETDGGSVQILEVHLFDGLVGWDFARRDAVMASKREGAPQGIGDRRGMRAYRGRSYLQGCCYTVTASSDGARKSSC